MMATGRRGLAEMAVSLSKDPRALRLLRTWCRTLQPGHGPLEDRLPWMNFKVIRWLESYLRPTMTVFEYGAGGSTVFVAERVHRLVSVEHDPAWFELVSRALREDGISNCDLRFVPPVAHPSLRGVPYGARSYTSYRPESAGQSFEDYVRTIDDFPDKSFDLVIIDGYARASTVTHAIPKVRPSGYLLLDDSDSEYAKPALPLLEAFPRRDFRGVAPFQRTLQQASIWRL